MELARSHFEKDAENLEEENRQLHDAILSQTSSHVEERDTATAARNSLGRGDH